MSNSEARSNSISWIPCEEHIHRGDGLPTHQIHRLNLFDNKIWMATASGLAIYDGETVKVLNRRDKLLSHGMRSIGESADYALICSDSGLDWLNRDSMLIDHQLNTAAKGWGLCEVATSISATEFLLGCAKGLNLVELQDSTLKHRRSWLQDEYITALASNGEGVCLLNSGKTGLWSYQDLQIKPIVSRKLSDLGRCQTIRFADNQFLVTFERGVVILDNLLQVSKVMTVPESLTPVLSFYPADDAWIWVATSDGVFYCQLDEQLGVSVRKCYLLSKQINDIACDHYGNLWCASEHKGLFKIPVIEQWIGLAEPITNNSYLSVRHIKECTLVGGTQQSFIIDRATMQFEILSELDGLQVWDLQRETVLVESTTSNVVVDELWAATNRGVIMLRGNQHEKQEIEINQPCRCLFFLEHYVLIGSVTGLYLYDRSSGNITPLHDQKNSSIGYVYSIQAAEQSTIYVCTLGRGLWRLDWQNRQLEAVELGDDYSNIYCLTFNKTQPFAVSADNHILKFEDYGVQKLFKSSLSVAAWAIERVNEDTLLLGTSEGLQILNTVSGEIEFSLDQFPNGSYWEFTTSRSLACVDDKVWCGLNDFFSVVDIQQLRKLIPPIQPQVVSLSLDSKPVQVERKVSVVQGNWVLKIDLSCYWFWSKSPVKYQYRLLGINSDWIDIMGSQIILTALRPGRYLLEVEASCNFSSKQRVSQLLELEVVPVQVLTRTLHAVSQFIGKFTDYFANRKLLKTHRAQFNHLESTIQQRTELLSQAKEKLEQQNKVLVEMSTIDPLTGLFNRRYFSEQALKEVKRAVRSQLPMCLLMIDIDHFKQYNDYYGHKQGDECLKQVALKLRKSFNRSTDITARYGGEEFIVLLPETTFEDAKQAVEKCLNNIRKSELEHVKSLTARFVTISVGLACETPQYDYDQTSTATFLSELIEKADVNLYHAKNNGRNRYHC